MTDVTANGGATPCRVELGQRMTQNVLTAMKSAFVA